VSAVWLVLIRSYRRFLSPLVPPSCRYTPSCSAYAEEAFVAHGTLHALELVIRRLARCHPWGGEGFDPVPEPRARREATARPVRKEA